MRRASAVAQEEIQVKTVEDLTGVFESLASIQVAKIKGKVEVSKQFFNLLWSKYTSIRVNEEDRITERLNMTHKHNDKTAFIIISAEAGLSGDIDQRLIEKMLDEYDPKTTDIVVLGSHGKNQLVQKGIDYIKFFQVPSSDSYIDASPVIRIVNDYKDIKLFYEEYQSLGVQNIKTIDLIYSIQTMSEATDTTGQFITTSDTIFEPSLDIIAEEMEIAMMSLALSQSILESSLAQDASRFNAMAVAKKRAVELVEDYQLEYHRAKRSENDRRMREVMISLKKQKTKKAKV